MSWLQKLLPPKIKSKTSFAKTGVPEGLWSKCPECNYICTTNELKENLFVCLKCNHLHRIGSEEYFDIIFDNGEYEVLYDEIKSKDFLGFTDLKPYQKKSKLL